MTPLETKIATLLVDCEEYIEPYIMTAEKWEIISKTKNQTQKQTKTVIDEKTSLAISYGKSSEKIKKLKSYITASEAFERDQVFSKASEVAGYWGIFDSVLQYLLTSTCKIKVRKILFNHVEALKKLRELRNILTQKHIKYIASTSLIGVTITSKRIDLPDEVEIIRLSTKEQNDRQPLIQPYYSYGLQDMGLVDSVLELRVPITVPVDHTQEGAFFKAHNDAIECAREIFGNIINAILIAVSGKAMLGSINLHGGIKQMPVGQSIPQGMPPHVNITIRKKDLTNISIAYDLVSGGKKGDRTLSRALHRFLLGRKRSDLVDKLVDYVISWEALLLTQEGNPIAQELSYRFSLNGASLLSTVSNKLDRFVCNKKMKAAYSVRSTIVHGGGDEEIEKALKTGDFNNIHSLCDYLETNFRTSLLWLATKDINERPYRKRNGWEELIWIK